MNEHTHHRSGDGVRVFWLWQKKTLAICLTVGAIGAVWVGIVKAQSVLDPHIREVACKVDSANHAPIINELAEAKQWRERMDSNIVIIKSILEVTATNDELIKAKDRRTNPTGIR